MSWEIKQESAEVSGLGSPGDSPGPSAPNGHVLVLGSELGIQNAADFHQAVLPLAGSGGAVRVDARAAKSVHTSIMQILYALSQAVPDFGVTIEIVVGMAPFGAATSGGAPWTMPLSVIGVHNDHCTRW